MAATFTFSLQPALEAARQEADDCQRQWNAAVAAVEWERQLLSDTMSAMQQAQLRLKVTRDSPHAGPEPRIDALQARAVQLAAAEAKLERCASAVAGQQRCVAAAEDEARRCEAVMATAHAKVRALDTLRERQRQAFERGEVAAADAEAEEAARQAYRRGTAG